MPGLFRKSVKPSKSIFAFALVVAVGLNLEFIHAVWLDVYVNGHHAKFPTLLLYWLLWNVFPFTIFGIGKLLHKEGK